MELDERSRLEKRHAALEAPVLLDAATRSGFGACGLGDGWVEDQVILDPDDPSIAAIESDLAPDAILFAATPRAVKTVVSSGRRIVEGGFHCDYETTLERYRGALKNLDLI